MRKRRTPRDENRLTVAEAAKETGVHISTVYRWIGSGALRAHETNGVHLINRIALQQFRTAYFDEGAAE